MPEFPNSIYSLQKLHLKCRLCIIKKAIKLCDLKNKLILIMIP